MKHTEATLAAGAVRLHVLAVYVICQVKNSVCQITCHDAKRFQQIAPAT